MINRLCLEKLMPFVLSAKQSKYETVLTKLFINTLRLFVPHAQGERVFANSPEV